jgi:hypothetical protein
MKLSDFRFVLENEKESLVQPSGGPYVYVMYFRGEDEPMYVDLDDGRGCLCLRQGAKNRLLFDSVEAAKKRVEQALLRNEF